MECFPSLAGCRGWTEERLQRLGYQIPSSLDCGSLFPGTSLASIAHLVGPSTSPSLEGGLVGIGPSSLGMGARCGVWLCLPSSSFVGSHVKEPPTQLLCLPVLFLPVLLSRVAVIQYHELVP